LTDWETHLWIWRRLYWKFSCNIRVEWPHETINTVLVKNIQYTYVRIIIYATVRYLETQTVDSIKNWSTTFFTNMLLNSSPFTKIKKRPMFMLANLWFFFSPLGFRREMRKVTISFVISIRLSVLRMKQLGCHWKDFHEILYSSFSKICRGNSSFIKILQE
jgi:hypothetical protein